MESILIAGGSGFIGAKLKRHLQNKGHKVTILTRSPKNKEDIFWDPKLNTIDTKSISNTTVLINLCGENISKKRWTNKRKKELISSRVNTSVFLFSIADSLPDLKHFIGASGINCYGNTNSDIHHKEEDTLGVNFISNLVKEWEKSHLLFEKKCKTTILRLPIVLEKNEGALKKMESIFSKGFGSILGSGNQIMNWISIDDLLRLFDHTINKKNEGIYNISANNTSNYDFSHALANALKRKIILPKAPKFAIQIIFGEMADILINGNYVSSKKILNTGFFYENTDINYTLKQIYQQ